MTSTITTTTPALRETVGIFTASAPLKTAIQDLKAAGVDSEALGLLASEHTVKGTLEDLNIGHHRGSNSGEQTQDGQVSEEASAFGGSLMFIGTAGGVGAIVATTAIFGGALAVAAGGIAGVGAIWALVASVIHQSDADFLQQQVAEGHILLFVRLGEEVNEHTVKDVLGRHAAQVKTYDVADLV